MTIKIHNYSDDGRVDFWAEIDTEALIEATLEPDPMMQAAWEEWLDSRDDNTDSLIEFMEHMGFAHRGADNTYNNENDLSSEFYFNAFTTSDSSDWIYDKHLILAVCVHQGGDVRGNYDGPTFYRPGGSSCDDLQWLEWVASWGFTRGHDVNGEALDNDQLMELSEEYQYGYTSNPSYHLNEAVEEVLDEDEKSLILKLKTGETVYACPNHYALGV